MSCLHALLLSKFPSISIAMVNASGRPSKACDICRKQKIRCSGERPSCKRCLRLRNQCHYERSAVRVRDRRSVSNPKPAKRSSIPTPGVQRSLAPAPLHDTFSTDHLSAQPDEDFYHGVPSYLVKPLVEEYFANVYQSDLLLHRDTFMQSLTEKTVRSHVLLSICAWGANFYRDENDRAFLKEEGLMTKWAKQAGALVFQEAEDLHEDNIVTFCNLSLFWHSQGSWRVSYLHKGNACQLLHIIGIGPQVPNSGPILEFEIRRRRFWACYLFHCFSSEKLFQFEAIADIHNLPLPWPEDDFEAGISRFPVSAIKTKNGGGVFAELIRGLTLWCSVVSIVRSKEFSFTSRLQEIFKVENEILTWWRGVATHFKLDAAKVASVKQKELPKILLTNIVYHQSLCALHASIVPLFCWSEDDKKRSSARQLSAQIAFDHACEISRLINAVLATQCRLSAMPIFVAYAAYSGCAVQIPFLWCTEPSVRERVQANVEANLKMIQGMSCYWKLASLLQVYVQCLHSVHKGNPPSISNEPKYADISAFIDFEIDASLAKSSILEFTGLLRSAEHGYTKPGEESQDLGTTQNGGDEILVGRDNVASASGDLFSESSNLPVDTIRPDPEVPLSPDRFVSGASEWPTFDVFSSLFDADMTSLLPQDQGFDLSFLTTDPVSWDLDATGN